MVLDVEDSWASRGCSYPDQLIDGKIAWLTPTITNVILGHVGMLNVGAGWDCINPCQLEH